MMHLMHKAGFVNIVGNPNVGKSTLMNQLVGERISIATFKAQTTRHRIMGIVNTPEMQIVFSDTPGVLKPNYKLQESMLAFSESALQDADVLLYVTDVVENPEKNMDFLEKVQKMTIPVILLINKIDELQTSPQQQLSAIVEKWHGLLPKAEILPISAKNKFGVDMLLKRIQELLPESPAYFDKDQLTDKPARFFVSEIIREKILLYYDKEIPYSVEVAVERFKEDMTAIYLIRDLIEYIIYFIALITILQFFGVDLAGTLLSLGIVGIAVSFAAKDIISNLFSGVILIIGKSIKVGDTIEINGEKGIVEHISLRTTVIYNDVGVKTNIPNSTLTNNEYLKYKNPEKNRVDIMAGLPLNIDVEEFKSYITMQIKTYDGISKNPKPDVYANEISFKQTKLKVSFWVKDFNSKDKYKIIITNEIRKFIGEYNE